MIQVGVTSPDSDLVLTKAIREIARRSVDGSIDRVLKHKLANTADSNAIAGTASETNFSTNYTISPSMFRPGRKFVLRAYGNYSTTGTPTLTFRVKFGTTNLVVFGAKTGINNASNQSWKVEVEIVCRSTGSSGSVMAAGQVFINTSANVDTGETVVNTAATTVDTTANQTLQISLTWSASSSSNTATLRSMVLELSDY